MISTSCSRIAGRVVCDALRRGGGRGRHGSTIFAKPKHPYTRALLEAEPTGRKAPPPPRPRQDPRWHRRVGDLQDRRRLPVRARPCELKAVDRVSVALKQGQTIGIVGESGSGKSTLARALLRLLPSEGAIALRGPGHCQARPGADAAAAASRLQIVLQDPFGSLRPRMTAGQIVTEGLLVHEPVDLPQGSATAGPSRRLRGGAARSGAAQPLPA